MDPRGCSLGFSGHLSEEAGGKLQPHVLCPPSALPVMWWIPSDEAKARAPIWVREAQTGGQRASVLTRHMRNKRARGMRRPRTSPPPPTSIDPCSPRRGSGLCQRSPVPAPWSAAGQVSWARLRCCRITDQHHCPEAGRTAPPRPRPALQDAEIPRPGTRPSAGADR